MANKTFQKGDLIARFLPTGALEKLTLKDIQMNQLVGNPFDGSLSNLYLRVKEEGQKIRSYPLIGSQSHSKVSLAEDAIKWSGKIETFRYEVVFQLGQNNTWFYDVRVSGQNQETIDLILTQDIGLALPGALLANEAYVSQYVDYRVFFNQESGVHVTARQNQKQGTTNPYMQMGTLTGATAYTTDGYQFFGKSYKWTNQAEALLQEHLVSEVYQYEFGFIALQSEDFVLNDETQKAVFYGYAKENHPERVEQEEDIRLIQDDYLALEAEAKQVFLDEKVLKRKAETLHVLTGETLEQEEIEKLYPERKLEEYSEEQQLLSFFGKNNQHIVLSKKEALTERSHGHIILAEKHVTIDHPTLASTSYMYGAFQSQLVLGNTSNNSLITNVRNPLNIFKATGQRIYLKENGEYLNLGVPSAYQMGLNDTKWLYKYRGDLIVVTVHTKTDASEVDLTIESTQEKQYEWVITSELLLEELADERKDNQLVFGVKAKTLTQEKCPHLKYKMKWEKTHGQVAKNTMWFEPGPESTILLPDLLTLTFEPATQLSLKIMGTLQETFGEWSTQTSRQAQKDFQDHLQSLHRHFSLTSNQKKNPEAIERMNTIVDWYTLDMLIHYLSPHGLEQFGGAAWGTRDVCQGPFEFFMATQHFDIAREILLHLFRHQFIEDGNWPQWFMFDQYHETMADESHGDIIVWPLKVVGDYLRATNDASILAETLPYMVKETGQFSEEKETLFDHLKREIHYIESHFLPGTKLSCYGDGDWDDTLQPADARLKKDMASTWTVALTYVALKTLADAIATTHQQESKQWATLAKEIQADYNQYMVNQEVLPGFVLHEQEQFDYIIHPSDIKTGIHYRLLPMIQSITSELSEKNKATQYLDTIQEKLLFPDGVHLMNKPAPYNGGVSTYFKRAEQAANFGREIGLQYVHAHIRYSETLSKVGLGSQMWQALSVINPILIEKYVPNAQIRQSNAYFSSSDGDFKTRYEAARDFHLLQSGQRQVKGGWRVYSSGPGIYLNQLMTNLLGIKIKNQDLVLDPVVPEAYESFGGQLYYLNRPLKLEVRMAQAERLIINDTPIDLSQLERDFNLYREGGYIIPKELLATITETNELLIVYEKKKTEGMADTK